MNLHLRMPTIAAGEGRGMHVHLTSPSKTVSFLEKLELELIKCQLSKT